MVNLKATYGEKLFPNNAYKTSKFIPTITSIIIGLVMAYLLVEIFEIRQDYAVLKVYGVIFIFQLLIQPIVEWPFNKLNQKLFLNKAVTSEVDHYLRTFNAGLTSDNSGAYEDYLLEAAFNETLDCKMRVLAAMQYARFVGLMSIVPRMDGIYYDAWLEAVQKYMRDNPEKISTEEDF